MGTLRGGGLGMVGLRMEPEVDAGADVADGLPLLDDELLGDCRQDATRAASDCNAAKAMSMSPRRTVISPLYRKSLTMALTVMLEACS